MFKLPLDLLVSDTIRIIPVVLYVFHRGHASLCFHVCDQAQLLKHHFAKQN